MALPLPAREAISPRARVHRWRAAAAAEAHARGVRLRGLLVEDPATDDIVLIVVTVERRIRLERGAPAVELRRGAGRAAIVLLRGDAELRRNGRGGRLTRMDVGDLVQVTRRPGAALVTALDAPHARRAASAQGTSTIFPRVCRRSTWR